MTSRQQILRRRQQPMQVVALIAVAYSGILLDIAGDGRARHHEFSNAASSLLGIVPSAKKSNVFLVTALISLKLMGRSSARVAHSFFAAPPARVSGASMQRLKV
ncbi:hypothetical protein [Mesorhizobium sp. M0976]|uniref:hypothetical protein n=1 Tax=Mesorhizobium sp. M0976 TaxID=2957038 RepID=UPI003338F33F